MTPAPAVLSFVRGRPDVQLRLLMLLLLLPLSVSLVVVMVVTVAVLLLRVLRPVPLAAAAAAAATGSAGHDVGQVDAVHHLVVPPLLLDAWRKMLQWMERMMDG